MEYSFIETMNRLYKEALEQSKNETLRDDLRFAHLMRAVAYHEAITAYDMEAHDKVMRHYEKKEYMNSKFD